MTRVRNVLPTRRVVVAVVLALFVVFGALCGVGCTSGNPALEVESPQAVLSPLMLGTGSAFMAIVNKGSGNDTLVAARAEIPGTLTELHDVLDGKMTKIEKIAIPAHTSVKLRAGGLHIMIFNLPRTVEAGQNVTLVLSFEKSGDKHVAVKFTRKPAAAQEHHQH